MKMKKYVCSALCLALLLTVTGCGSNQEAEETVTAAADETAVIGEDTSVEGAEPATEESTAAESTEPETEEKAEDTSDGLPAYTYTGDAKRAAICDYLINEIGQYYSDFEVSIPYMQIVDTDESDPEDTLVWGDFYLMNYNLAGDILETSSGGSHPGLMHLQKQTDGSFLVTSFEQVADGSDFDASAKKIFGDRYDDFIKIQSDDETAEAARVEAIRDYVKANGLSVTAYQDYGWDPVPID